MTTASVARSASVPIKPDALSEVLGVLIVSLAALWWIAPVLITPGWPMDHEVLSLFERVEAFRRELALGHWYPVWTPYMQHGYGSPFPLFYHRLSPWLAAALSLATGMSVIASVKALTAALLILAGLGMRELLRVSGATEPWAVAGALLFLVCPYVLTDWLVRGALAEFAALALLPWLYAGLCQFAQGRRSWVGLALLVALLFHAHSMICYFFLLSGLGFVGWSLIGARRGVVWGGVRREIPEIAIAAVIAFAGIVPQVIVATSLFRYFDTDAWRGIPGVPLSISQNYRPFHEYLADPSFHWGAQWRSVSVEVNRYATAAAIALHLLPGATPRWRWVWRVPLYPFLLGWTLFCLALQLPAFEPVFNALPGGHFLQFAWRLLAFMTIGLVFVVISAARAASRAGRVQRTAAVACVVLTIGLTVRLLLPGRLPDQWAPPEVIDADLAKLDGAVSFGEYLLRGMNPRAELPARRLVEATGCAAAPRVVDPFTHGELLVTADEPSACELTVRQLQTPILAVELHGAHLVSRAPSEVTVIGLEPGKSTVRIRPRTFPELLLRALERCL